MVDLVATGAQITQTSGDIGFSIVSDKSPNPAIELGFGVNETKNLALLSVRGLNGHAAPDFQINVNGTSLLNYTPQTIYQYVDADTCKADLGAALLVAAAALAKKGGGVLIIPSDEYTWTTAITIDLAPNAPADNFINRGLTIIADGVKINHTAASGYALTLNSTNTSAGYYNPTFLLRGASFYGNSTANGAIRLNNINNSEFQNVFAYNYTYMPGGGTPTPDGTQGCLARLSLTLTHAENNRFLHCGAVTCQAILTFTKDGSSESSFARTTVYNMFGATATAAEACFFWFGNGCTVYDSHFMHIVGNLNGRCMANIGTNSMDNTVFDGLRYECNNTTYNKAVVILRTHPQNSGVVRRPALINVGAFANADYATLASYPIWANASNSAVDAEASQKATFNVYADQKIIGKNSADQYKTTGGSGFFGKTYTLSGTSATNLDVADTTNGAKGAFLVLVSSTANDAPSYVWAVTSSANGNSNGSAVITALSSKAGQNGTTLTLAWPTNQNYLTLAKSTSSYDGNYNIVIIGG